MRTYIVARTHREAVRWAESAPIAWVRRPISVTVGTRHSLRGVGVGALIVVLDSYRLSHRLLDDVELCQASGSIVLQGTRS